MSEMTSGLLSSDLSVSPPCMLRAIYHIGNDTSVISRGPPSGPFLGLPAAGDGYSEGGCDLCNTREQNPEISRSGRRESSSSTHYNLCFCKNHRVISAYCGPWSSTSSDCRKSNEDRYDLTKRELPRILAPLLVAILVYHELSGPGPTIHSPSSRPCQGRADVRGDYQPRGPQHPTAAASAAPACLLSG